ncbi:cupin domain-containing protein [Segnochrobactrum spirostomi]|uniref:Cupin domain-containing protein n=1 Tax=Segnochrobactrum spirostomi TaxID=2608987 RepID=A0A6A7Y532_9HYPH|nr:cupin domain-containing protein [Segnochrobactrum spirostomi]MQT14283.1 cupin domain-containing protein [Segnochrobactrum spirostomi]
MSARSHLRPACPAAMTVRRAGDGVGSAPDGISSGPFLVQSLLESRVEGEMTAIRAFVEPGVMTYWHSHPRGQLLFVLDGVGIVEREGDEPIEVRAGDAVWFAPGERHRHGAAPGCPFGYLSVQPVMNGTAVHWFGPDIAEERAR